MIGNHLMGVITLVNMKEGLGVVYGMLVQCKLSSQLKAYTAHEFVYMYIGHYQ
jgi:hypothetical protein